VCGIAGVFDLGGGAVSPVMLRRMTDAIAHRGPDGEGFYVNGCLGFGHRRLAIIDLTPAAHQPMQTADGRFILTYNGEIYNFEEIRIHLESIGHQFHSKTDSEVVLKAWNQWGAASLDRFNGMFAFAVWDNVDRTLTLARDRYGIKPLYYTLQGRKFLFGSEVKAILAHVDYRCQIDREAVAEYFTFQNFLTERTLFKGVNLLPPGTFLRISPDVRTLAEPVRYWDYHFVEPDSSGDETEYLEELDHLFRRSVNRQLISDVEIGSYLSGGMDSGSITALASRQLPYIKTFTCGFDLSSASGLELQFDERAKAEFMSAVFKTEHYEMVLKAGDMERCLPKLVYHLEEPRVGQSYPNYYAANLAGKFVKVVLSGAGGDELFGGYPWRYYRAVNNNNFDDYISKYYSFWQRLVPDSDYDEFFRPMAADFTNFSPLEVFREVFRSHASELKRPEDYVNHSLYFEARTFLHSLLIVDDKLSMAHGLETRVPFLDNDLVDFAMKLPVNMKLGNLQSVVRLDENDFEAKREKYFNKTNDGKLLLRKAMQRYIPEQITSAVKQGFSAPDASWFRGESIDYVTGKICHRRARIYEFLDEKVVMKLVNEHISGKTNRRLLIWSLINFELWLEKFL
jgi:asparagine synthase (glutamine-hydrolysing)